MGNIPPPSSSHAVKISRWPYGYPEPGHYTRGVDWIFPHLFPAPPSPPPPSPQPPPQWSHTQHQMTLSRRP